MRGKNWAGWGVDTISRDRERVSHVSGKSPSMWCGVRLLRGFRFVATLRAIFGLKTKVERHQDAATMRTRGGRGMPRPKEGGVLKPSPLAFGSGNR